MAGSVGLLRFPDTLTRLHALTKADNLGLGLVVLGLMARAGGPLASAQISKCLAACAVYGGGGFTAYRESRERR